MQVLDHGVEVEALEFLGIVERFAHRIGGGRVGMEHADIELLRPPVAVPVSAGAAGERALARAVVSLCVHVSSPIVFCSFLRAIPYGMMAENGQLPPARPQRPSSMSSFGAKSHMSRFAAESAGVPLVKFAGALPWKISNIRSSRIVLSSRSVYLIGMITLRQLRYLSALGETRPFRPRRRGLCRDPAGAVDADPRSRADAWRRRGGAAAGRGDADRCRARNRPPWRGRADGLARSGRLRPPSQRAVDGAVDARRDSVAGALSAAADSCRRCRRSFPNCGWNCARPRPGSWSTTSRAARSMPRCWRCRSASPTSIRLRCSRICFCSRCPPTDPRPETTRGGRRRHRSEPADPARRRPLPARPGAGVLRDGARGRNAGAGGTAFGASSLTTVMQMVAGGYGVTLIPQIAADVERRDDRVKFLRLKNPAARPQHRPRVPPHLAAQGGFCGAGRGGEGECGCGRR